MPTISESLTATMIIESAQRPDTKVQVYTDMDGVVADFQTYVRNAYHLNSKNEVTQFFEQDGIWEQVAQEHPHLFNELPLISDAKELMTGLIAMRDRGWIGLSMLSALPNEWYQNPKLQRVGSTDKQRWVTRHFQKMATDDVIVCLRKEKVSYAIQEHVLNHHAAVLIDDFKKNITEWQTGGSGMGILHVNAKDSLRQLQQYLSTFEAPK